MLRSSSAAKRSLPDKTRSLAAAFGLLGSWALAAGPAHAQAAGGDLGGFIQNIIDLLNSDIIRGLAVLAVILTGVAWMFGQIDLRRAIHAGSCAQALEQLALLVRETPAGRDLPSDEVRALLSGLIDILVQMDRVDGRFRVVEVRHGGALKPALAA